MRTGYVDDEVEFGAAHAIFLAQAVVGGVDLFANFHEVAFLHGGAGSHQALVLVDDEGAAAERFGIDFGPVGFQFFDCDVAKQLYLRTILLDHGNAFLALGAADVVFRRGERVLDHGVDQDDLDAFGLEGHQVVHQAAAVQAHDVAFLAEDRGELVHDAAADADVVVLGHLADLRKLSLREFQLEDRIQGGADARFEGCRRGHAGAQGHVAAEHGVEAAHGCAALAHLFDHAIEIRGPLLFRLRAADAEEQRRIVMVDGNQVNHLGTIGADGHRDGFVHGARQHEAAVIVGMFADDVDTARGREKTRFGFAEIILEALF